MSLATPTSSFDRLCSKYSMCRLFPMAAFLVSSNHETFVKANRWLRGGGGLPYNQSKVRVRHPLSQNEKSTPKPISHFYIRHGPAYRTRTSWYPARASACMVLSFLTSPSNTDNASPLTRYSFRSSTPDGTNAPACCPSSPPPPTALAELLSLPLPYRGTPV